MDDRALRSVTVGLGGKLNGPERAAGFDITAASEVMAILTLSRNVADLRQRLASIVPAWDAAGKPVTAADLDVAGAMAAILVEALQPNLMHTSEGSPAMIHTGPFGNIAPGNCSVTSDLFALGRSDYVVTEAGFASDLGAEKFFHLKCPVTGEGPNAVVLATTLPCIRGQAGGEGDVGGPEELAPGLANLARHVAIMRQFEVPVVVAINSHPEDSEQDVATVKGVARDAGAAAAVCHEAYLRGGAGATELAQAVVDSCSETSRYRPLVERDAPVEEKVGIIASKVFGAAGVEWSPEATGQLERLRDAGFGNLPLCMAKTHLSLSHDPKLLGAPTGFVLPVREVRLAAGAGYVTVLNGDISTMPGMPSGARYHEIDVLPDGTITGLT
jgi:formate--tetrahydrofolate ligase